MVTFKQFFLEADDAKEFLWHGSPAKIDGPLEPRQAKDISERPEGNQKAVYATEDKDLAIAMTLGEKGSDHGMIVSVDNRLVSFDGKLRTGEKSYLYKLPIDTFENTGEPSENPEWISYEPVMPIAIEEINTDDYIPTHTREATEEDWNCRKNPTECGK